MYQPGHPPPFSQENGPKLYCDICKNRGHNTAEHGVFETKPLRPSRKHPTADTSPFKRQRAQIDTGPVDGIDIAFFGHDGRYLYVVIQSSLGCALDVVSDTVKTVNCDKYR